MKARYNRTFEYGKKMSKYCIIFSIVLCVISLLVTQGSVVQIVLTVATVAMMVATVVCIYKYCICPYCGKHIVTGVLTVKNCPRCRRSLVSGKKIK